MKLIYIAITLLISFAANATQIEISGDDAVQTQGRYSYNFGTVWVNSRVVATFNMRNTGNMPLTYKDAIIYGGDFSATHSCDRVVLPNETCSFSIYYWPMFEGMSSGQFILNFVEDEIVFDLWGQSRRM